ncbi:hypothetical protein BGZ82_011585 [Podila clonocystis]|nr:hypothetical protein BGZ82_011585 [Podila clonocystis]
MLRLTKSFPFFQAQEESLASTFIAPSNGYNISVPTRNGLDNYYGPGTVFQGQLNLQLMKPIKGPCRLRVILACTQTIGDVALTSSSPGEDRARTSSSSPRASQSSDTSSTGSHKHGQYPPPRTVFAVEHILLQDMAMAIKRHTFLFTVKFPMCNFPPSFQDGDRSLVYSVHSDLTFLTQPEDPSSESMLSCAAIQIKYLPMVPTSIPKYPVIEMAQAVDQTTNQVMFKASLESEQRGFCPGETLPLNLTITNLSLTELHSIHLSLVRVISYPALASSSAPCSPGSGSASGLEAATSTIGPQPESTTVHTITIPVSKTPNSTSTWVEPLQFKLPSDLGLVPTTNKIITPLFKVDYYISVSVPVASRSAGIASWFTSAVRGPPPPVDISLVRSEGATGSDPTTNTSSTTTIRQGQRRASSGEKSGLKLNLLTDRIATLNSNMKWPTLIQLPLIPVIIGTVPYRISERQLRWPIPNYMDVNDRPCFIRDRFEEEMMQQIEHLETLMLQEGDEKEIEDLIQAAIKSVSSGESDEDESRAHARIPARFRTGGQKYRKGSMSSSGLGTPPPSPPTSSPMAMMETVMAGGSTSRSGHNTLPRMTPKRPMSPKAAGLGKELLLEMHHSKVQQTIPRE